MAISEAELLFKEKQSYEKKVHTQEK